MKLLGILRTGVGLKASKGGGEREDVDDDDGDISYEERLRLIAILID